MEKNIRQLAAIMFTDMVGYTALMQEDEKRAKQNRDRHRKVLESSIQDHFGIILQYFGDGTLSIFGSAIEAINCAIEIQEELQTEPKIPLRVGIHTGDIAYDDEGVYGDGVNVASRIENLSIPGGILISEKVYDDIKNHKEISVISLGKTALKNVKKEIEIFAISNQGLSVPSKKEFLSHSLKLPNAVAVLPFVNMSNDPENTYFSDGISEEIINVLTKVDGLHVTARSSSFVFKDKNVDIRQIAEQLGVSKVLEGSVRKAGNKVRITAQLINSEDGFHVFSEVYDRELKDIFAIQDEIALKISHKLQENLSIKPSSKSTVKPPTKNIDAYDLYLKGLYSFNEGSPEAAKAALNYFEQAIEREPDFALPYCGLSHLYSHYAAFKYLEPEKAYTLAKENAQKAITIDENLAESHLALAHIYMINDWNFQAAQEEINTAIKLSPGSAEAHSMNATLLTILAKLDEALSEARFAYSLDPLSPMSNYILGNIYYCMEDFHESIEQYSKAIKKLPNFQQATTLLARSYLLNGELEHALALFQKLPVSPHKQIVHWGALGYIYAKKGQKKMVDTCLENIKKQEKEGEQTFITFSYLILFLGLKQYDQVFKYLKKGLAVKSIFLIFMQVDPLYKDIRNNTEFIKLAHKTFGRPTDS